MSRFVCLPRLFEHKTHQITRIHTYRYNGSRAVVSFIAVVIWNFHRYQYQSLQSARTEKKNCQKKNKKKSYEVHREYQSFLRCNVTGSRFPFCTQFLMCFSVQNTSCLLFIFFSLFSFLLFSADFLSFVRVVVLNFLIFKHLHINSADNDEVIRCRFDICTWAHILSDIRV